MSELAQTGDFCPNPDCPCYGQTGDENIIRFGFSRQGRQRLKLQNLRQDFQ